MNNGCICCTVRGDLIRILGDLKEKRDGGKLKFDRVVIETTGMADPGPVAQTFFTDEEIGNYYLLDSILTVVDAKHAPKQLDEFHEAQEQVGFADRILMSKTDLVSEGDVESLSKRLKRMNPARADQEGELRQRADRRSARHPRLQPERDPRARPGVPHRHRTTSTTTRSSRSCSSRTSRSTAPSWSSSCPA